MPCWITKLKSFHPPFPSFTSVLEVTMILPCKRTVSIIFFSDLRKPYQRIRSYLILASLCLLITFTHEATGGIDKQLMRQGKPTITKIRSELIKVCDQSHGSVAGWLVW